MNLKNNFMKEIIKSGNNLGADHGIREKGRGVSL